MYDYILIATSGATSGLAVLFAVSVVFFIVACFVGLAAYVLYVVGLWKIFAKAGEDGWKSLIPFYNTYVLVKTVGLSWWWFLLAVAPSIVGLVSGTATLVSLGSICQILANVCIAKNLSMKIHKDTAIIVLLVLFPVVMYPVLGLGSSTWDDSVQTPQNGVFGGDPLK